MVRVAFFFLLATLTCLYAFPRGGPPERWAAGTLALAIIGTLFVHWTHVDRYSHVPLTLFLIDLIVLAVFTGLALRSTRSWPIWCAGFQLVSVSAHAVRWIDLQMAHFGYSFLESAPIYLILPALAAGTWRHQRRLKEHGTDPAWRTS